MIPCTLEDEHRPLGAILPDEHLDAFAAMPTFTAPAVAIPPTYSLAGIGRVPVLDQGQTPECELYTDAGLIGLFDTRAGGSFREIDELKGYHAAQKIDGIPMPHDGTTDVAALTIAKAGIAYRSGAGKGQVGGWQVVDPVAAAIMAAMASTGNPVGTSWKWPHSWFHPNADGIVPAPDYTAGGHRTWVVGWVPGHLVVRNSWGRGFARTGDFLVPFAYVAQVGWGAQVIAPPVAAPKPVAHHLHIAAGAQVHSTTLDAQSRLILPWKVTPISHASSAPCSAPVNRIASDGTPAHVALVSRGVFARQWVHVATGDGTSVVPEV